jgi:hypothetical protein
MVQSLGMTLVLGGCRSHKDAREIVVAGWGATSVGAGDARVVGAVLS